MNQQLEPFVDDVRAHYDLSDDFFALFLDPSMTYSCAYFERDDMTLEEAQTAKIDLALGKLDLKPGMTLLDIGCGWGALVKRAVEKYDVNVIGLTLSRNQYERGRALVADLPTERNVDIRLQGWEEFDEPVDRIVSVGAFEHFGFDRYGEFFKMAYRVLPDDGVMMLHTICGVSMEYARANGVPLTMELVRFIKFIMTEIFPGGQLCKTEMVGELAADAGFTLTRTQSLQPHYARTLDLWAEALEAHRDEAIALQSQEVYDRYMHYLTGCARLFKLGQADVNQFTFTKAPVDLESTSHYPILCSASGASLRVAAPIRG
jgi:cyclopropane-fatty-acyl-phospholipid synthase